MGDDMVKVRLKLRPGDERPPGEGLWAKPVDAHDGGGVYVLQNSSFFVPLGAGDRIRAELDDDSDLQVVDVVGPSDAVLTVVVTHCEGHELQAMMDRWAEQGAVWTEGADGLLVTVWREGLTTEDIETVLGADLAARRGAWIATAGPEDRTRDALSEVDFEVERSRRLPTETRYWAADDPYWESVGLADPEFLAQLQTLAGEDEQVARALERGQHERVLIWMGRLAGPDPGDLPPPEGPLSEGG